MLRKVENTNPAGSLNMVLMRAFKTVNPVEKSGQCRFMLFVRLRPGIHSHFKNLSRTGYYRGDKYTDQESLMLCKLLKMVDKRMPMYDRVIIYDNSATGDDREILVIGNDCIEKNSLRRYSLMLANFILPQWMNS